MRVFIVPATSGNPYLECLAQTYQKLGADPVLVEAPGFSRLARTAARGDALHLHWIEGLVGSNSRSTSNLRSAAGVRGFAGQLVRCLRVLGVLALLRLRGIRLVWTVHNRRPHEARFPMLDWALGWCLVRVVDLTTAHSDYASREISRTYRCRKPRVCPHGNYIGWYPASRAARNVARARRGYSDTDHVFLAFGLIRSYKGLPELATDFHQVAPINARLLIVGGVSDPDVERSLRKASSVDPRIRLELAHVPDECVAEVHQAADTALFAYGEVFSSGAVVLALSLGVSVLGPAGSALDELAGDNVVSTFAGGGLKRGLEAEVSRTGAHVDKAIAAAASMTWEPLARAVLVD